MPVKQSDKQHYKKRYQLIIDRINESPATHVDIATYLINSDEFQNKNITAYSIRTLQRDIIKIERLYNIVIHNRRKINFYYIVDDPYK